MTQRQKTGLYIIAVLAIARFLVVPWIEWLDGKMSVVQALEQNKDRFQSLQSKNTELSGQQKIISDGYKALSNLWFDGDSAQASVKIMQHIERMAKKHKIELSTRQAGQPGTLDGVSAIPLSLFVKGRPADFFAFVLALETVQPVAVIQSVRLTKANVVSQDMTATLDLAVLLKPERAQ